MEKKCERRCLTVHDDGDGENGEGKDDAGADQKAEPPLALGFFPLANPALAPGGGKVD